MSRQHEQDAKEEAISKQPKPREIELPHHGYQPSKAELEQDHRVDATFDEIVSACLQPVKITYAKPPEPKR